MKVKKGKILKVIPGINPNCSSGMFAFGYTLLSIPLYLVINIITSIVLYKLKSNKSKQMDLDVFKLSRSIWRLKYVILLVAVIWIGLVIFTVSVESHYGSLETWIMAGIMVSFPPLSLIVSLFIGERILFSKRPKLVFLISPLLYLALVAILWFSSGLIFSAIRAVLLR